jgi:apolipoprotein D and lipocalin family protein
MPDLDAKGPVMIPSRIRLGALPTIQAGHSLSMLERRGGEIATGSVPRSLWSGRAIVAASCVTLLTAWMVAATATASAQTPSSPSPADPHGDSGKAPLQALPQLDVPPYMGTWYQVALFPNFFQRQCISDTTATYRLLAEGRVEVTNRCRTESGAFDQVIGVARPTGALRGRTLAPAQLEVTFLPRWLRWLPVGWGRYWVIQLADDGRYAVISEPSREYLWILSRQPRLDPADEALIRARLKQQGFADLSSWQSHRHTGP